MKLGITLGYSGARPELRIKMVQEAERLGYDIVWSAESYGADAIAALAWVGAQTEKIKLGTGIMQMAGRTPASTAMAAMALDQISGGRFVLGLGLSGPQVVEGWHGQSYAHPLGRTREYVEILRKILAREGPLVYDGKYYQIPYQGEGATGLGKPLKSIIHGRADMPIYLASSGPKNVRLTAEIADGWLPFFFSPEHYDTVYREHVEAGFARAGNGKGYDHFSIAASVMVKLGDNVQDCRDLLKPYLAFSVGGMGARGKNFYHDLVTRFGYGEAAGKIQELYLSGNKAAAIRSVPDELVDHVALCGPKARIRERLAAWMKSPVTTLNLMGYDLEVLRVMAELVL